MIARATLTDKGTIHLPSEVCHYLGLKAGDNVEFVIEGGQIIVRSERTEVNPFEKFVGIWRGSGFPDSVQWVRYMRREEDRCL